MGHKIKAEDLTDLKKINQLIEENQLANMFTDDYIKIAEGKKLGLKARKLKHYNWEIAYRIDNINPVTIIGHEPINNEYLFVLQPRATLDKKQMVLSFPSGMIEKGHTIPSLEKKIKERAKKNNKTPILFPDKFKKDKKYKHPAMLTALLELKEETGYFPTSCKILTNPNNPLPKSAGMTSELDTIIECVIDKNKISENVNDKEEDINYLWMDPKTFIKISKKIPKNKVKIENGTWLFMYGLNKGG